MKFYVNGQDVGSADAPAAFVGNDHEVSIGSRQNFDSDLYSMNFDGLIDEVVIYDYALSGVDVLAHFDAAFVPILDLTWDGSDSDWGELIG